MKCYRCCLFVLLLAAVIDQGFCNEAAAESHIREKRQGPRGQRGPPHRPGEGPRGNSDGYRGPEGYQEDRYAQPLSGGTEYNRINESPRVESRFAEAPSSNLGLGLSLNLGGGSRPQNPANMGLQAMQNVPMAGLGMGGFTRMPMLGGGSYTPAPNMGLINLGVGQNMPLLTLGGGQNTGLLGLGGQQNAGNDNRPNRGPQGPEYNNPPGHYGERPPPAHQGDRPSPEHQGERQPPGHQGRPGNNQPGRPGQQPGRPGQQPGRPGEQPSRPGQQPGRPGYQGEDSFVDGRPSYDNNYPGQNGQQGGSSGRPTQNSGQNGNQGQGGSNGRPNQNSGQNGNQGQGGSNGRPNQNSGQNGNQGQGGSNGRPNQNSGQSGNEESNAQQLAWQNQGGGGGGGNKKCRGNQYTCQNRECVPRNARCNGVNECQDGSDELNCGTSDNGSGGADTSTDRFTTAAPITGLTTASPTGGCILPEKPTGGSYELGSCEQPCNLGPGTKVPLSSYLTYRCDTGYTLKGNNVSFCHGGTWYLPPTCAKTCPPLKSNSVDIVCKYHGETVSCESAIAPGTKATLACKHSYKIPLADDPAYREITCLEEGIWDRTLFRCLPECGTAVAHGNTLIVSGFTAKLGVFPWHVGIYQKNSAEHFDQICAGTLVSPDLVISAAHCFYDDTVNEVQDVSQYAVGAGKHYRLFLMPEKYAQTSLVKKIDVAARYYGASGNFAEDIALVRLETPFTLTTLVRPVCMDWDNTYEREQLQSGQSGKAVGWGKTAEGVPSTELQEINLPYIPYQECVSAVPEEFKAYVTADKFCAGYLNGSSLCEGDSGGGLCFQLNGLWYLRGIVSVSPVSENTCDNNYYTAFTNVGRFREWIRAAYVNMA